MEAKHQIHLFNLRALKVIAHNNHRRISKNAVKGKSVNVKCTNWRELEIKYENEILEYKKGI